MHSTTNCICRIFFQICRGDTKGVIIKADNPMAIRQKDKGTNNNLQKNYTHNNQIKQYEPH